MHVFLCILDEKDTDQCSLGFGISMLQLQPALALYKDARVTVRQAHTLQLAIADAADANVDVLVAIRSMMTFPPRFVLRALVEDADFVVGAYALPRIDWERVASAPHTEDARFRGNTYNFDGGSARLGRNGYVHVSHADLGAVVLKKPAFDPLLSAPSSSSEDLCRAWGRDVAVDIDNACSMLGRLDYVGCLGARAVSKAG